MGLSSFPTSAEGVLTLIVMNSVWSVTLLKNTVRSLLQAMNPNPPRRPEEQNPDGISQENSRRERRVSITQFRSLCKSTSSSKSKTGSECCVCLCGFEADEEVSELSCKHFFHKNCLDKWFGNKHFTCPLCRSIE